MNRSQRTDTSEEPPPITAGDKMMAGGLAVGVFIACMVFSYDSGAGERVALMKQCEAEIGMQILNGEKEYVDPRTVHTICWVRHCAPTPE